ncbi:MAG: hypothetical protein QGH24_03230 [Candidatus Marinimicrobia bacterium]|jgi:hypothetical protein|nr:hypothetical protein [Candidatus Neomarinimicrobiota bacterium]|tara:strand:- start:975 stop:1316 length:342 start_codon:yes stop_codon:yes gene_type:complete
MMNIDEIIEDIVLLKLENFEPLKDLGIIQKSLFAKILGHDEYGIWIHHPKFQVAETQEGKQIKSIKPPKTREVEASVLIPWGFIVSIVHFPGVEGFDFPNPLDKHIGFDSDKE